MTGSTARQSGPAPLALVGRLALGLALAAASPRATAAQTLGAEFRVNTYTPGFQEDPSVAMGPGGSFVVVWMSYTQDGSSGGVFAQRFDAAGDAQGSEFQVNSYTPFSQRYPSAGMDASGNFVVAWLGPGQQDLYDGIHAQRFDAAGIAQGSELRVNTSAASPLDRPSVAMNPGGSFVVAWVGPGDGSGDVFARRFDAAGNPQGGELLVNTSAAGYQRMPSVATGAGGSFVVAWVSPELDGNADVFARRFDAAGIAQGSEFLVNTYTTGYQGRPSVAMDASGNFVVAWWSPNLADIFARRFDAAGVAQGGEIQVNASDPFAELPPSAAMGPDGSFVVAWQRDDPSGDARYVSARRFDAAGVAQGGDLQVLVGSRQADISTSVAMDAMGRFVVAWVDDQRGDDNGEIFAQRFDVAQSLSIDEVAVTEGGPGTATATFNVTLSPASLFTVTVAFATADGTATDGSDYAAATGTLTFDPGVTTRSIEVTVNGDTADETTASAPSETFFVGLSAPTNAWIADGQGQGTILDDDVAPGPPMLDPPLRGILTVGATETLTGANFTAGSVIKLFVNTGASIDDVSGASGFTPTAFTANTLTWEVPPTVPLGQGFASIFVVNTDQGFATSNTQYALLYGDADDNIPTVTSLDNTAVSSTLEAGVPVAHADTVIAAFSTIPVRGTGFSGSALNVFAASASGADQAPTPTPCPVANYGGYPVDGGTPTRFYITVPPVPAGPANFQVVNAPFFGNVQSNAVSALVGAVPSIASVSVSGGEVTLLGTGFSCLSVINLFNLQGTTVVNLGGLAGGGQRAIPLQFISASELRFQVPAGAVAGPAFVEVLNPPFIPFSSSGNDPDGGFVFP
jgi:hypothetical protein